MSKSNNKKRERENEISLNNNKKIKELSTNSSSSNNSGNINSNKDNSAINNNIQSITFKVKDDIKIEQINTTAKFDYIKMIKSNTNSIFLKGLNKEKDSFVVKSSISSDSKVIQVNKFTNSGNSFVWSAIQAFSNHHKLIIRPDNIWYSILGVFSTFVNNNLNKLRNKLVDFQGKKELVVYTNESFSQAILNNQELPIDQLLKDMVKEIQSSVKDPSITDWLVPSFSTTTDNDKLVYSVALMSTLKGYFDWRFESRCGLPQVTLLGTLEDWLDIKSRFNKFKDYDCGTNEMIQWSLLLNPVLDKFIETVQGNPDLNWWNSIVKLNGISGGPYITGWITCFCIYDIDNKYVGNQMKRSGGSFLDANNDENESIYSNWLELKSNHLPSGFLATLVKLQDFDGSVYNSELYSGHLTVNVLDNKSTFKSNLDWCLIINKNKVNNSNSNNKSKVINDNIQLKKNNNNFNKSEQNNDSNNNINKNNNDLSFDYIDIDGNKWNNFSNKYYSINKHYNKNKDN